MVARGGNDRLLAERFGLMRPIRILHSVRKAECPFDRLNRGRRRCIEDPLPVVCMTSRSAQGCLHDRSRVARPEEPEVVESASFAGQFRQLNRRVIARSRF